MENRKHSFCRIPWALMGVALIVVFASAVLVNNARPAAAQGAWYAEYFSNPDLAGGPALTRYVDAINFDWGHGSPGEGIPNDNFSARWTRQEWFESGTYRFSYRSDDGVRIWVGDTLVVDDWREREAYWTQVDRFISQGTYTVRVEYFERGGAAAIETVWNRISGGEAWTGEYYSNRDLSGASTMIRYDRAVDFHWGYDSPDPSIPPDNFSVRWTYKLGFTSGNYRFFSSTDDGVRVYVDGTMVIDAWYNQQLPNTHQGDIYLDAREHTVMVEYYEQGGEAAAHVWWNKLEQTDKWQGNYFDNRDLVGGPALVRNDETISFDWGVGGPAPWMPSDNFSARWTRQISFPAGNYRLNVRTDDGVRVYVDDQLVMDYWQPQDFAWHYLDNIYLSGQHTLKIEYFEGTGYARIRFWWEPTASTPSPGDAAPPATPAPGTPGNWQGTYFNSANLTGPPVLTRRDEGIAFDWGYGSPAEVVNRDNFSVRWDGAFWFQAGQYTFRTFSDDGVRVYVDGRLVINSWYPMRGYRNATVNLTEGTHRVRVEYFERTGRAQVRASWTPGSAYPSAPITGSTPPAPAACAGGTLQLNAWPVNAVCNPGGGWVATIFVEGRGGDCAYVYEWENHVVGGPTPNAMTFDVVSASWGIAIVGEAAVDSAGQRAEVELHVPPPLCYW